MVNFGIVGCGHISRKHALALERIDDARLVAVHDNDFNRIAPFKKQYGVNIYVEYNDFLTDPGIDAVIICTPSGLHASMGLKAALAGKHILIEKPFALNLQDGQKLINTCREKNVKLGVVHPNRLKPVVQGLYRAINEGWFGEITHASAMLRWNRSPEYFRSAFWRGTRELDGGILFNQAIHNIDLFNWLIGPVVEVFAYGATRLHDIECEDVCVSTLKLHSGALGVVEAAVTLYPENLEESLAIFGSRGTAVLGGKSLSKILEWKFSCLTEDEARQQIDMFNNSQPGDGHTETLGDFVGAINDNRAPLISGEEALKTLNLIISIYQSIASHRPVKINI